MPYLNSAPDAADFVSTRYGWVTGQGILATTDGGRRWRSALAAHRQPTDRPLS